MQAICRDFKCAVLLLGMLAFCYSHNTSAANLSSKSDNPAVTITANYTNEESSPENAIDGSLTTKWLNTKHDFHFYDHLAVDLGKPARVSASAVAIELDLEVVDRTEDIAALSRSKTKLQNIRNTLLGLKSSIQSVRDRLFNAQLIRDSTTLKNEGLAMRSQLESIRSQLYTLRSQVASLRQETSAYSFLAAETLKLLALEARINLGIIELNDAINKLGNTSQIPNGYNWNGIPQQARDYLSGADYEVAQLQMQNLQAINDVTTILNDLGRIQIDETPLGGEITYKVEYFNGSDWQQAFTHTIDSGNTIKTFTLAAPITAQKWRIRDFKNEFGVVKHVKISEWQILGEFDASAEVKNTKDGDHWRQLAGAPIDECFVAPGSQENIYPKQEGPCPLGTESKKNEAYLWGMTHYKLDDPVTDTNLVDRLYFGSGANVMCLAIETYLLISTPYYRKDDLVCEFQTNKDGYSDWRPPSLYIYDFKQDKLMQPELTETADLLRSFTTGFRSAGNHNGIVFIGGPNLDNSVNMFAFLAATGTLIGGTVIDYGYSSFRKMKVIDGELYVGMGGAETVASGSGGAVLRWKGDMSQILIGNFDTLFDFEIVGTGMAGEATEVNAYNGKILASSWPDQDTPMGGSLWLSSSLPLSADSTQKKLIWNTNTAQSGAVKLVFESTGDLVLKDSAGQAVWSSGTANIGATKALLQDNGKLAIYGVENALLWASDENWQPKYPRINAIATAGATVFELGQELAVGESIQSRNGHYRLVIQANGDLQLDANEIPWQRIWSAIDYDPDPHVASTYGVGPAREFDGWVYWGTMHVPSAALIKHEFILGKTLPDETRGELLQGFHREGSIFRGRNLGEANQEIQLLYGGQALDDSIAPGHYPVRTGYSSFESKMNKMGLIPLYGKGGFDNPWNNYIWSMAVYNGDLYIGTMDHGQIALDDNLFIPYDVDAKSLVRNTYGSDLFKIEHSNISAMPVSTDGLGNPTAYGIRTMAVDDVSIFMGTANNANLNRKGGWQLLRFTADEIEEPEAGTMPLTLLAILLLVLGLRTRAIHRLKHQRFIAA